MSQTFSRVRETSFWVEQRWGNDGTDDSGNAHEIWRFGRHFRYTVPRGAATFRQMSPEYDPDAFHGANVWFLAVTLSRDDVSRW